MEKQMRIKTTLWRGKRQGNKKESKRVIYAEASLKTKAEKLKNEKATTCTEHLLFDRNYSKCCTFIN